MSDLTDVKFFLASLIRPIVKQAIREEIEEFNSLKTVVPVSATDTAPVLSSKQVKEMTGWPDGTFYQKVAEMPEGVVIRGKSKRLLFDRELFMQWLKAPVEA